jgi:glutathione peroxidase
MSIYDFKVKEISGKDLSLSAYKGKVLLIVNTATKCGLTPQYDALQALYENHNEQGFEILDFPSNQFKEQAPESSEEINKICKGRFGITFKQFAKIDVNGQDEDPLYTYLKKQKGGLLGSKIKWNFTKFLVDRNGQVVKRYAPTTTPDKIEEDIIKLL